MMTDGYIIAIKSPVVKYYSEVI